MSVPEPEQKNQTVSSKTELESQLIQLLGKELGVKYVLEGSVQKSGDRIRLTAQFIDAQTGNHLWAERYDRHLEDIFELQDELTIKILWQLNIKLYHGTQASIKGQYANNIEAFFKSWQGLGYFWKFNKNDNEIARKIFEDVIESDPKWAGGYAFLSLAK